MIGNDYELSENQKQFVRDAEAQGHEVRYDYSGRGMYGRQCPAVVCAPGEFGTKAAISRDNMGLDMVFYAQR
jgi:hypothetical protein